MWRKLALLFVAHLNGLSAAERYAVMGLVTLVFLAINVVQCPQRLLVCQRAETLAQFACAVTGAVLVVADAGPRVAPVLVLAVNVPALLLIPVIYRRTRPLQAQRALRRASSSFNQRKASLLRWRAAPASYDVLLELRSDRSDDGRGGDPRNSLCSTDKGLGSECLAQRTGVGARGSLGSAGGTRGVDVHVQDDVLFEWHSDADGSPHNPRDSLWDNEGLSAEHLAKLGERLDATE